MNFSFVICLLEQLSLASKKRRVELGPFVCSFSHCLFVLLLLCLLLMNLPCIAGGVHQGKTPVRHPKSNITTSHYPPFHLHHPHHHHRPQELGEPSSLPFNPGNCRSSSPIRLKVTLPVNHMPPRRTFQSRGSWAFKR